MLREKILCTDPTLNMFLFLRLYPMKTRLKIIDMLSCGEMCACTILEEFSISQSTLSYHMKILAESGLVNAVRDGAWMRYTLNKEKTKEVLEFYTRIISEKADCICCTCRK